MTIQLKISLHGGIKGFSRIYLVHADSHLYSLHKQLRSDLEFPGDQLILFKALAADETVIGRYGLFDLGDGTVDNVRFRDLIDQGLDHFLYFYDVTNKKSVIITLEGEVTDGPAVPVGTALLTFSKGPIPAEFENGYVAYEDLPEEQKHVHHPKPASPLDAILGDFDDEEDEDDEDLEEEEDDDEDGKEIYDENE